jgi:hypothetical protein
MSHEKNREPETPLTEEERETDMRDALDEWQASYLKADIEKRKWEASHTKNNDLPI